MMRSALQGILPQARDANVATSALHTGKASFVTKPFAWIVAFGYRRVLYAVDHQDAKDSVKSEINGVKLSVLSAPLRTGVKVTKSALRTGHEVMIASLAELNAMLVDTNMRVRRLVVALEAGGAEPATPATEKNIA